MTAKLWRDHNPHTSFRILSKVCLCDANCLPQVSLPSVRAVTLQPRTFELLQVRASTPEDLLGCFNSLTAQKIICLFFFFFSSGLVWCQTIKMSWFVRDPAGIKRSSCCNELSSGSWFMQLQPCTQGMEYSYLKNFI